MKLVLVTLAVAHWSGAASETESPVTQSYEVAVDGIMHAWLPSSANATASAHTFCSRWPAMSADFCATRLMMKVLFFYESYG